MKRAVTSILLWVLCIGLLHAQSTSFHAGVSTGFGFFSGYVSAEAGVKKDLSDFYSLGLAQRIRHGLSYQEVLVMTELRAYVHDDLFFHLGASYLARPSEVLEPDFSTRILPFLGAGLYIPLGSSKRLCLVPRIEINQSFYLSDGIRPIYTDLPFPIATCVSLGLEYRMRPWE